MIPYDDLVARAPVLARPSGTAGQPASCQPPPVPRRLVAAAHAPGSGPRAAPPTPRRRPPRPAHAAAARGRADDGRRARGRRAALIDEQRLRERRRRLRDGASAAHTATSTDAATQIGGAPERPSAERERASSCPTPPRPRATAARRLVSRHAVPRELIGLASRPLSPRRARSASSRAAEGSAGSSARACSPARSIRAASARSAGAAAPRSARSVAPRARRAASSVVEPLGSSRSATASSCRCPAAAAVAGDVATAYTLYARTGLGPREPVVDHRRRPRSRASSSRSCAPRAITPIVVARARRRTLAREPGSRWSRSPTTPRRGRRRDSAR